MCVLAMRTHLAEKDLGGADASFTNKGIFAVSIRSMLGKGHGGITMEELTLLVFCSPHPPVNRRAGLS